MVLSHLDAVRRIAHCSGGLVCSGFAVTNTDLPRVCAGGRSNRPRAGYCIVAFLAPLHVPVAGTRRAEEHQLKLPPQLTTAESEGSVGGRRAPACVSCLTCLQPPDRLAYSARLKPIRPSSFVFRGPWNRFWVLIRVWENVSWNWAVDGIDPGFDSCEPGIRAMLDPFR